MRTAKFKMILLVVLFHFISIHAKGSQFEYTRNNSISFNPLFLISGFFGHGSLELSYQRVLPQNFILLINPEYCGFDGRKTLLFADYDNYYTEDFFRIEMGIKKQYIIAEKTNVQFSVYPKSSIVIGYNTYEEWKDESLIDEYEEIFGGPLLGIGLTFQRKNFIIDLSGEHVFDFQSNYNSYDFFKFKPSFLIGWSIGKMRKHESS